MTCADATQKHTPYRHTSLKIKLNDPKNDPLEKVLVTLRGHPTVVVRRECPSQHDRPQRSAARNIHGQDQRDDVPRTSPLRQPHLPHLRAET